MKDLSEFAALETFWKRLSAAQSRVLMLDYDGTLAPFRTDRKRAFPYPEVAELIAAISGNARTRVVVISGREASEVAGLLSAAGKLEIWGSHGLARLLPDGGIARTPISGRDAQTLEEAAKAAEKLLPADRIERKYGCVAAHFREMPRSRASQAREQIAGAWNNLDGGGALELREFDGGIELKLAGMNKGDAVNRVLEEAGEGCAAAYLGDDLTDEDAFVAIGERGLAVLVRKAPRETAAALQLIPPKELLWFLDQWLKTCIEEDGKGVQIAGR